MVCFATHTMQILRPLLAQSGRKPHYILKRSLLTCLRERHIIPPCRVARQKHLPLHLPLLLNKLPRTIQCALPCWLSLSINDISASLFTRGPLSSNRFSCATPWLKKLPNTTPAFRCQWPASRRRVIPDRVEIRDICMVLITSALCQKRTFQKPAVSNNRRIIEPETHVF